MGSFEKLIVLTLVFLSIIVLVFSLGNQGPADPYGAPGRELERAGDALAKGGADDAAGRNAGRPEFAADPSKPGDLELAAAGPQSADTDLVARELIGNGPVGSEPVWSESGPATELDDLFGGSASTPPAVSADGPLLLSAGEADEVPAPGLVLPEVNDFGQQRILLVSQGLERTVDPDSLAYTTLGGETWRELSRIFYGNARQAGTLRNHNEDADPSVAGQTLFLPIYAPEVPIVAPRVPRAEDRVVPGPVAGGGEVREAPAVTPGQDDVLTYVTQDGDTLSSIALEFYDSGNKWALIFEANSDVLSNPNVLRVGVEIRLPGATRP